MEVSFHREIESLKLGAGEVFHGEGILAVTKALLQSGVTYVGGYQGSPVSHLLDVMVQARPYLDTLGVHVEACTNESSAAAMLAASMAYPVRGAVTWKSIVGTNVAADALSNLASPGVLGGALIVVGEDYGEGASVIQERSHAFAMKSALWLLDPRPDLPSLVRLVGQAFELSEASNTPVMMELRIRSCHLQGSFVASDNVAPRISSRQLQAEPAAFSYDRLSHPPSTFRHEKLKYEVRMPAARQYIVEAGLNELIDPPQADLRELGLIVQGGLTHSLLRALEQAGLTDADGQPRVALLVLNCVYPLVPQQITSFCEGRRAVLVVEEGQPDYIEQDIATTLRRAGVSTPLHGKDLLSMGGEYNAELLLAGLAKLLAIYRPEAEAAPAARQLQALAELRTQAAQQLGAPVPPRPPNFCIGCPERPVFAALKLAERDIGRVHVSADIGCHSFANLRAVLVRPVDPRLRHEHGLRRGGAELQRTPAAGDHGRRRLLAQRSAVGRVVDAAQRRRRRAADHEKRLHLGHRHAGDDLHARLRGQARRRRQQRHRRRDDDREDAEGHGRQVAAHGAQLPRGHGARCAEGGADHALRGPEGDRGRGRMPARAPAPPAPAAQGEARARRARGAHPATASTTPPAPGTIPASACPAARR